MRKLAWWVALPALAAALIFLAGCTPKETPFAANLSSLVGTLTYDQAVAQWGAPREVLSQTGGKLAVYHEVLDTQIKRMFLTFDAKGVLKAYREDLWCCLEKKSGP